MCDDTFLSPTDDPQPIWFPSRQSPATHTHKTDTSGFVGASLAKCDSFGMQLALWLDRLQDPNSRLKSFNEKGFAEATYPRWQPTRGTFFG